MLTSMSQCVQGDIGAVEAHIKGLDFLVKRVDNFDSSPTPITTMILKYVESSNLSSYDTNPP